MIDLYAYSKKPTRKTIASYPTIMDILEGIAYQENVSQSKCSPYPIPHFPLHLINHKGKSIVMLDPNIDGGLELYPASQRMSFFYRGQSQYFAKCKPSLFRMPLSTQKRALLLFRLQAVELLQILLTHPVINDIQHKSARLGCISISVPINPYALAQHYGILTPYIDMTADKWTAAFFATTDYCDGKYTIHSLNQKFKTHYGVFYIIDAQSVYNLSSASILPVGLQFFNRPGCQSALVMDLTKIKDFHKSPYVKPIFFRHDDKCSKLVYTLHNKGTYLFPDDSLGELVERLVKAKQQTFSRKTVEDVRKRFYPKLTEKAFKKMVLEENWAIVDNLATKFSRSSMKKDKEIWEAGDNLRFLENLIWYPIYSYRNIEFT